MANGEAFTTKEIVIEIRDAVKDLARKIELIDRQGSIGTKTQLDDHEQRIRTNEAAITNLQDTRIKREEIHGIRNDISAIRLSLAGVPSEVKRLDELVEEVEGLSNWRMRAIGAYTVLAVVIPSAVTIGWQLWG